MPAKHRTGPPQPEVPEHAHIVEEAKNERKAPAKRNA